jgi:hypothetical protein
VLTGEEALRYAMSLPVATTITGIDKTEALQQALKVAQGFQPMQPAEMQMLRDRCRQYAADGRFELYKLSLRFDNPKARLTHRFPLDMQQVEVREINGQDDREQRASIPAHEIIWHMHLM